MSISRVGLPEECCGLLLQSVVVFNDSNEDDALQVKMLCTLLLGCDRVLFVDGSSIRKGQVSRAFRQCRRRTS